jgi:hypothetical protein
MAVRDEVWILDPQSTLLAADLSKYVLLLLIDALDG